MPYNTPYQALNDILNWAEDNLPESISEVTDARVQSLIDRIKKGESIDRVVSDVRKYIIGSEAITGWVTELGYGEDQVPQVVNDLIAGKTTFKVVEAGEYGMDSGAISQALPQDAKLVKIGNQYRVVWNLGDGMGWAWYSIDRENLERLFKTATPDAHLELSNLSQFNQRFGRNYWGNISEVNLTAATPWEDLKEKIYANFGWVPGLDDPEVRRLILQGYFENWNETQFTVEYKKSNYYNTLTDAQRAWVGYSEAERAQQVQLMAVKLANEYRDIWGKVISVNDPIIKAAANKIASGAELFDKWSFDQANEARKTEGTPEWNRWQAQQEEDRSEANQAENLGRWAEEQWREWVGPGALPQNFGTKWGKWLAEGTKSEADLDTYLQKIANSRWQMKPPDVTWADWSAPFKSQIRQTLELNSLDDADPLLQQVLNTEVTGYELNQLIRQDKRFLSTKSLYNQLSNATSELGRQFGFLPQ